MKHKWKRFRRLWKKLKKKLKWKLVSRTLYFGYREKCPIEDKVILVESVEGNNPMDNVAAIVEELALNPVYEDYTIYLSGEKSTTKGRKAYLRRRGMERVNILQWESARYFKVLATAKYLVSETSFHYAFIKRPEQVYLNTWHGTPLKTLGKKIKNDYAMLGNVQKNFFDANYLLCPNEFTMNCLVEDYMLANFGQTRLLLTGYPRNCVLRNKERRAQIRKRLGLEEKQVIIYMPTWRGTIKEVDGNEQNRQLMEYLLQLDGRLEEDQVMYVKLHRMNKKGIDLRGLTRVLPFPEEYTTYEFLNASDTLVTDYSSVFFDYAITGHKTVLFTYDKEEYLEEHGVYFSMEELPFPQVDTMDALVQELKLPKQYDDTEFLAKFCPYDDEKVTEALCQKLIFGRDSSRIEERALPDNGKKNIVLFIGWFEKNGITTSALNILNNLDRDKYNLAVVYRMNDIRKRPEGLKQLPEDVAYMGFYRANSMTIPEFMLYTGWKEFRLPGYRTVAPILENIAKREMVRILGYRRIDEVVHFNGYVPEMLTMMELMPCEKVVFVHNDMEREADVLKKIDKKLLSHMYKAYDKVALVTEDLIPVIERIVEHYPEEGSKKAEIVTCRNVIDYKRVQEMAEAELVFDEATVINVPEEVFLEALDSDKKKLITIGRFAEEKCHKRLITAFETLHREYPDTILIIVGGYGRMYAETMEDAAKASCADSIFIIRYMSNPYPLLKKCDYFVMSSLHEGLPVVLTEADVLGLPCFSTDIPGPRNFMQEHGGLLVENSEAGVLEGLRACMESRVPKKLDIDYEEYNKRAIAQFEQLICEK